MDDLTVSNAAVFSGKSADYQLAEVLDAPGYRNEYLAREGLAALRLAGRGEFKSVEFREKMSVLQRARPLLRSDDPVALMTDALAQAVSEAAND